MGYYVCPRCSSNDVYFNTESKPTSYRGNDGQYQTEWQETSVAYCRACMVKADYVKVKADIDREWKIIGIGFSIFLALILITSTSHLWK
jgi:hypothetical protein